MNLLDTFSRSRGGGGRSKIKARKRDLGALVLGFHCLVPIFILIIVRANAMRAAPKKLVSTAALSHIADLVRKFHFRFLEHIILFRVLTMLAEVR